MKLQIYDVKHNNDCRVSLVMCGGDCVVFKRKKRRGFSDILYPYYSIVDPIIKIDCDLE